MKLILAITHKPYQATLTMRDDRTGATQWCWSGRFKTMQRAEAALNAEADEWEIHFAPTEMVFKKERDI